MAQNDARWLFTPRLLGSNVRHCPRLWNIYVHPYTWISLIVIFLLKILTKKDLWPQITPKCSCWGNVWLYPPYKHIKVCGYSDFIFFQSFKRVHDPINKVIWRFHLIYVHKPYLVPTELQISNENKSYNLTSDDLWPWYVTFDLSTTCIYDPRLVEIHQSMWKIWPNVNFFFF